MVRATEVVVVAIFIVALLANVPASSAQSSVVATRGASESSPTTITITREDARVAATFAVSTSPLTSTDAATKALETPFMEGINAGTCAATSTTTASWHDVTATLQLSQ